MSAGLTPHEFAARIDHALLRPDASFADVERTCQEASHYGFASVSVNPGLVGLCAYRLADTPVAVNAAVAFPFGQLPIPAKVWEANLVLDQGATEIDYVVNLTEVKAGSVGYVATEMQQIVDVCHARDARCTVIFETCFLTDREKRVLCDVATDIRPDFVRTSTGFGSGDATPHDVELMRRHTGPNTGVKAYSATTTLSNAVTLIDLGAARIGSSEGVALIAELVGTHSREQKGGFAGDPRKPAL